MKKTTIIAAVDRFPDDDAVLLRGMEIAARHNVPLTIVHIVNLPDHAASPALINTFRGQAQSSARDRIKANLRRHGIHPPDCEIHVDTGNPAQRLAGICEDLRPALVVMRAHHKPWIVSKLFGSTTEKLIASGHAPVLIVRPTVEKPYERVVLAIEGPDTAPAALSFVTALLPQADVHMVQTVAVAPQLEQAMLRVGLAHRDLSAHHDLLVQDAESRLGALAAELVPPVTWQVLRGEPAEQLARATHESDVDLIALGPNRSGLLRRIFVGSVTRRLLQGAACDVLIGSPFDALMPDVPVQREPTAEQSANSVPPIAI